MGAIGDILKRAVSDEIRREEVTSDAWEYKGRSRITNEPIYMIKFNLFGLAEPPFKEDDKVRIAIDYEEPGMTFFGNSIYGVGDVSAYEAWMAYRSDDIRHQIKDKLKKRRTSWEQ